MDTPSNRKPSGPRLPLLLLAMLTLLSGLWAGLLRLGWQLPPLAPRLAGVHGPLMVSGFLGTLISLERVVALDMRGQQRRIYYLAPLLAALGALLTMLALPPGIGRSLSVLGAAGLVLMFGQIYRLQPTTDHAVMGLGALLWLAGNGLWLAGQPLATVAPWWAGFFILTIAGERLELARVLLLRRSARGQFLASTGLLLAGLLLQLLWFDGGLRFFSLALLAIGFWLLRYDIARRTIRRPGLTRFMAACLLPGYVWLVVAGLLWLTYGGQYRAGPIYDAMLHAIFLGFVFSMIFGHAPVIFPALTGREMTFSRLFYVHLGLLQVTVLLRVGSDLLLWQPGRQWAGLLNEVALVIFLLLTLRAIYQGSSPTSQ
jgi:hypothetical protein